MIHKTPAHENAIRRYHNSTLGRGKPNFQPDRSGRKKSSCSSALLKIKAEILFDPKQCLTKLKVFCHAKNQNQ